MSAVQRPARVIAIALADLVRAREPEAARREEPTPAPTDHGGGAAVTTSGAPSSTMADRRWSFAASVEARRFPAAPVTLFGVRCAVSREVADHVVAWVDAGVVTAGARDPLGTVTGTLGTIGATVLWARRGRRIELAIGPRMELGAGWFRGHATATTAIASTASSPLALVALSTHATVRIAGQVAATVELDAGETAFGFAALADQRTAFPMTGASLAFRAGLVWRP